MLYNTTGVSKNDLILINLNFNKEFWNELSECVGSFSVVVLGDLNPRVGNEVIEGIVGRHGVPGTKWRTTTGDVCRAGVSGG